MSTQFIVINIGCLEWGISSNIVGIFADEVIADSIAAKATELYSWKEGGQDEFIVFTLPELGVIHPDYPELKA